jgi:hypothetical protein
MPQADIPLHGGPPEVEIAIFKTEFLRRLNRINHHKWRDLGRADDLKGAGLDLDFSGGQLGVDPLGVSFPHDASDSDDIFGPDLFGFFKEPSPARWKNNLDQSFPIPHVHEHQITHIPMLVNPAEKRDLLSCILSAELSTIDRSLPVCHLFFLRRSRISSLLHSF